MKRSQVICNFCDSDITGQTRVELKATLTVSSADAGEYDLAYVDSDPFQGKGTVGKDTREMDICMNCVDRLFPGLTEQGLMGVNVVELPDTLVRNLVAFEVGEVTDIYPDLREHLADAPEDEDPTPSVGG